MNELADRDGPALKDRDLPTWRMAYSDRAAWLMAVMAEAAYIRFEDLAEPDLRALAQDLAQLNSVDEVVGALDAVKALFEHRGKGATGEDKLRTLLENTGFTLVGTFFNASFSLEKNTEGFVTRRNRNDGNDFVVLAIRGTSSLRDWKSNVKTDLVPNELGEGTKHPGSVHRGFQEAYMAAADQIDALLDEAGDLPLFVCGHSLGGAVAVMATMAQHRDNLAACYTFGAPRVGNYAFNDAFRTPIYRVVNSFDPVPMVPPSGAVVSMVKFTIGLLKPILLGGVLAWIFNWLLKVQGYRHAGDLRYMTAGERDKDGRYPTVKHYTTFGLPDRLMRLYQLIKDRKLKRLDVYHNMSTYRRKLRSRALSREPLHKRRLRPGPFGR